LTGGSLRFQTTQGVTRTPGEHGRPRCDGCLRPTRRATGLTARPVVLHPYRRGTPGGCSRDFEEILGSPARRGLGIEEVRRVVAELPLTVVPFDDDQVYLTAALHSRTRDLGFSLADCACLSLAGQRGLPAVTAERSWAEAPLGVDLRLIRQAPVVPSRGECRSGSLNSSEGSEKEWTALRDLRRGTVNAVVCRTRRPLAPAASLPRFFHIAIDHQDPPSRRST
jgi:PIN domain nuclease of toxin-antitoxin system